MTQRSVALRKKESTKEEKGMMTPELGEEPEGQEMNECLSSGVMQFLTITPFGVLCS